MAEKLLVSQVSDDEARAPWTFSLVGHGLILLMLLLGVELCPPKTIELGSGAGGGGDTITVGLVGELSGGAGMVKPGIVQRPQAFASPQEKKPSEAEPQPRETVFEQAKTEPTKPPKDWRKERAAPKEKPLPSAPAGVVPQPSQPGSGGPAGGVGGVGAGTGGVLIGSGPGTGGVDSWYVRQVERRVGDNWLKTALGDVAGPVVTKISFEIAPNGQIEAIEIEQSSGLEQVDRAARRAVLASNPLPPLPFEMRRRRIKFVANFQYPPR